MGELRFNVTNMTNVLNCLTELIEQLNKGINDTNNFISAIGNNINGTGVKETLKGYKEKNLEIANDTKNNLQQLEQYLQEQITKYSTTENQASEDLSNVTNILSILEG